MLNNLVNKQMDKWLERLEINVAEFSARTDATPAEQLQFIRDQSTLVDATKLVMDGKARFGVY